MSVKYRTGTHKSQTKLNLVQDTIKPQSTPQSVKNTQETPFHTELYIPSEDFIAARIEEGEDPQKALELWEIALKNRNRRK